jgi:hypothetical protein
MDVREKEREGAWGGSCSEEGNFRPFMNILDLFPKRKDKDLLMLFNLLRTASVV